MITFGGECVESAACHGDDCKSYAVRGGWFIQCLCRGMAASVVRGPYFWTAQTRRYQCDEYASGSARKAKSSLSGHRDDCVVMMAWFVSSSAWLFLLVVLLIVPRVWLSSTSAALDATVRILGKQLLNEAAPRCE